MEVKKGEIVAVVSIWQLTWTVIGYLVLFLGICAAFVALLRHPKALTGLAALADLA